MNFPVYANYFYDTSVIFSNSFITYREPFRICIGYDRRTDVIGIDWFSMNLFRWKGGGGGALKINAFICMGTHSQSLLQKRLMDVYETW